MPCTMLPGSGSSRISEARLTEEASDPKLHSGVTWAARIAIADWGFDLLTAQFFMHASV